VSRLLGGFSSEFSNSNQNDTYQQNQDNSWICGRCIDEAAATASVSSTIVITSCYTDSTPLNMHDLQPFSRIIKQYQQHCLYCQPKRSK